MPLYAHGLVDWSRFSTLGPKRLKRHFKKKGFKASHDSRTTSLKLPACKKVNKIVLFRSNQARLELDKDSLGSCFNVTQDTVQ